MASIVSERYALSLYEIARDEEKVPLMLEQLTAVAEVARQTPGFLKMLCAPAIQFSDKKDVIKGAFEGKIDPYLLNFLLLITEKGRVGGLYEMQEAFKARYYDEQGICEAHVTTAVPMDEALTEKLTAKLAQMTGKKIVLRQSVDKALLGGIVLKLGNEQIDTSLRSRLAELAQNMNQIIA